MTTPKVTLGHDLQRKHRLKRRLLRTLSSSRKQKHQQEDAATDSDDSEVEGRIADQRKQFFETKRMMDQSLEGKLLRETLMDITPCPLISRLLPPAEAEMEPDDNYEQFGRFLKRQDSNSTIHTQDSMMARLAETNESPERPQKSVVIDKLSQIGARDEFYEIFTDDVDVESSCGKKKSKNLFVRFADDHGEELEQVHWTLTMYSEEENDWIRAIILLLSPKKRKFEFLHVSYNIYDKTTVGEVLNQLPDIATDEALKEQSYVGLVRKEGERELINTVSLQSYYMKKNEILIGVVEGHYGKSMLRMAKPLFLDKKIMKAVTKSKSKRIIVTKLTPLTSNITKKEKDVGHSEPVKNSSRCTDPMLRLHHIIHPVDDNDYDGIPDMNSSFHHHHDDDAERHRNYLANDDNKDKVTLTRFLNAGIMTAVVYGLQRTFHRGGKR